MLKQITAITLLLGVATASAATEKLSFPHAAELTAQAKQIIFQEVNESGVPNSVHQESRRSRRQSGSGQRNS